MMNVFAEISIFELIFNVIQEPLQGLGNTLPAAIVVSFLNHLLWFFGLHGTNIIGSVIEPVYLPLIQTNLELFQGGMSAFEVPYIVTKPFLDSFVFMGGSGATIALLIAIFIVIRHEKIIRIEKLQSFLHQQDYSISMNQLFLDYRLC